jgi:hypothetical protein
MQIRIREGDLHCVSYITGPTHNFLGLRFGEADHDQPPRLVERPPSSGPKRLDPDVVLADALAGVQDAAEELGVRIVVREVHYVAEDSTSPASRGLYRLLARRIALHVFGPQRASP